MAAQLMATNGRSARGLLQWIARRHQFLPGPRFAWISTVDVVGATR